MHYGIDAALIPVVCTPAQWSSSSCRQSKTPPRICGVALLHFYSVTHGRLVITILLLHDLAFLLLGDGLAALGLELLTHLLHHHVNTHDIHTRTLSANRDNVKVLKSPLLISPAQSCTAAPPTHHLPAACTRTALVAALPAAGPLKVGHVFAVLLTSLLLSEFIQSHLERVVNTAVSWGCGCCRLAPQALRCS